jgi:hypothetical protein
MRRNTAHALADLGGELQRLGGHYNPDQPRAPAGTTIGGRWIASGQGIQELEERRRPRPTAGQMALDFDKPAYVLPPPEIPPVDLAYQPPPGWRIIRNNKTGYSLVQDETSNRLLSFGEERHAQWWLDMTAGKMATPPDDIVLFDYGAKEKGWLVIHPDGTRGSYWNQTGAWSDWRKSQRAAGRTVSDPPPAGQWSVFARESLTDQEINRLDPRDAPAAWYAIENRTGAALGFPSLGEADKFKRTLEAWDAERVAALPEHTFDRDLTAKASIETQMRSFERDTLTADVEFAQGWDVAGRNYFQVMGEQHSVSIPSINMAHCAGGALMHNHPSGSTFSESDVISGHCNGLRMEAVTGDVDEADFIQPGMSDALGGRRNWRFTMRYGRGTQNLPTSLVALEVRRAEREQMARGYAMIRTGQWTPLTAWAHHREMWPRFCERMRDQYGAEFEYSEEAS